MQGQEWVSNRSQLPAAAETTTTTTAAGVTHRATAAIAAPASLPVARVARAYLFGNPFKPPDPSLSLPDLLGQERSVSGWYSARAAPSSLPRLDAARVGDTPESGADDGKSCGRPRARCFPPGPERPRPGAPCETICASTALWHAALTCLKGVVVPGMNISFCPVMLGRGKLWRANGRELPARGRRLP